MKILQIPMADSEYTTLNPIGTLHPGEVLLEYLESSGWTQRDLARRSGVTPKTISEIATGKLLYLLERLSHLKRFSVVQRDSG